MEFSNDSKITKEQKKVLFSSMSGLGLQSMSTMLLSFVLATMISDFGINGAAEGFISTITNIGMLVGGIIFGTLADRRGRVRVFVITVAIFSIATGAMAFANNIYLVYLFRFLVGVGGGGEYGVIMSMIADSFSSDKRGRINSYVTISGQIGSIVAAIAAAIIIPAFGWRALFVFGTLPIFLAIYAHFKLEEPEEWKKEVLETQVKPSIKDLFIEGRASVTIRLTIMAIAQVAGYFGLMNWLPSILQNKVGLTVSGSSYWMIVTIVGMSVGMLFFGQIMDKVGAKFAYSLFLIASAIAVFIYSFADSGTAILIGGAAVGFFCNGMNAGYGAIVGNLYPSHIRATANNIIFNIGRAVGGFSSVFIGFFLDNYSLTIAMLFLSVLYIVSLLSVLSLKMKKGENQ
ncbi:MFS transporter [Enterococcus gallinarum]|uniref:MFS transporter n=1 Tax=Enterococcus gallinarum TaxID=1353 RepID=UPI00255A9DB5|nr:MFS transporter [Enterococcus gallinarum]MDL4883349.1 MFS transporter [Enterococcus gallinarum]MDL4895634.1 MFS transporter [Enterococcus gallinarum]